MESPIWPRTSRSAHSGTKEPGDAVGGVNDSLESPTKYLKEFKSFPSYMSSNIIPSFPWVTVVAPVCTYGSAVLLSKGQMWLIEGEPCSYKLDMALRAHFDPQSLQSTGGILFQLPVHSTSCNSRCCD